VEFHPSARVLLTAGLDQTLTLFQVDGKKNPKIQSIYMEKFPILNAHFNKTGDEIIMGSRHKTFSYYDMMIGKIVNVPAVKALEEHRMASFEISPNNELMAFVGSYGSVHLFSAKVIYF
jgi:U3 small nucleolar RNA-associated protein 18